MRHSSVIRRFNCEKGNYFKRRKFKINCLDISSIYDFPMFGTKIIKNSVTFRIYRFKHVTCFFHKQIRIQNEYCKLTPD